MRLERYPPGAASDTLQAWEDVDEYLLQACPSAQAITGPTLIFNDAFGVQGRAPFCVRDSYLSQLATRYNLAQNTQVKQVTLINSLAPLPPSPCIWLLEHMPYRIHNHANVFSRTSLDIGARFFCPNLPQEVEGTLVDLGCGNGILGLMALTANPLAEIHFVDESYMAIASSRLNISENRPVDLPRWTIIILRQRLRKGIVMLLQELEMRLDATFSLLENNVIQRQHVWRQGYQSLQHQLEQCLAREARLREHNAMLVGKLNSLDSSPDLSPLPHKIKIISAHIDTLAKEAAAFRQSCQH